jgi:hypothetical protein
MLTGYRGTPIVLMLMLMLAGAAPAFAQPTSPPPGSTDPAAAGTPAPGAPVTPVATAGTYSTATWPLELTLRPVVLGTGMIEIRGDLFIGLSKGSAGKPFLLTPTVYYGVNEQLTLGLFQDSFCFSGSSTCKFFDSLGVDAIFALLQQANIQLAVRGALEAASFDAGFWRLRIGALGKYYAGRLAIQFDPKLLIGLNKRSAGNGDILSIPLDIQYQIDQMLAAVVTIGIYGPLDGFSDAYGVPVGLGAHYTINRQLDVAGQFLFLNLLGKTFPGTSNLDYRALQFFLNYRI